MNSFTIQISFQQLSLCKAIIVFLTIIYDNNFKAIYNPANKFMIK